MDVEGGVAQSGEGGGEGGAFFRCAIAFDVARPRVGHDGTAGPLYTSSPLTGGRPGGGWLAVLEPDLYPRRSRAKPFSPRTKAIVAAHMTRASVEG